MISKEILIFPWAKRLRSEEFIHNPKDYNAWPELVNLLKKEGYKTIQISLPGEREIGADELITNKSLKEISEIIKNCYTVITVDSMANHLCWYLKKKAIVIFSQSSPDIYGHPENINLLKDKKYLRPSWQQFDVWESTKYISEAFVSPEEVLKALKENFN
jgi:ADP-heptose:LPS heptosyltransferase